MLAILENATPLEPPAMHDVDIALLRLILAARLAVGLVETQPNPRATYKGVQPDPTIRPA